jgi:glycosyltransferase involved in cell wall biosynthesis
VLDEALDRTRRIVQVRRNWLQQRWRQPPKLRIGRHLSAGETIYYLAPHGGAPSGGVRNIYRHVDLLNSLGASAGVIHDRSGYRANWFLNDTRVIAASDVRLRPTDIIVVPEGYGVGLGKLPGEVRKVIFNQGPYYTFDGLDFESTTAGSPYVEAESIVALLTVSRDGQCLLRYAFPTLPTGVARVVVDSSTFWPSNDVPGRRLAFLTHRRRQERNQLLHILRGRGVLSDWELVPIFGRTEIETAGIMRESPVFLSFSEREGFGLPPAEAMASGCYVVGYTGRGGDEYFYPDCSTAVNEGDLLSFAKSIEEVCNEYDRDSTSVRTKGLRSSERISEYYSTANLRDDLSSFYSTLLS